MEPLDLYHASREALIDLLLAQRDRLAEQERVIARPQAEIARLGATIGQVTRQVGEPRTALAALTGQEPEEPPGPGRPTGMPGLKPGKPAARPSTPRRPRPQGFARRRMEPTAWQTHAVEQCPRCGIPLAGGTVVHRREVIEVPVAPVIVTEHVWLARRCPCCARTWRPPVNLAGVVVGQGRLGVRLVSLLAVIRSLLPTLYGLQLRVGGIVRALQQVATHAGPVLAEVRAAIRGSPVAHLDETGWRENGQHALGPLFRAWQPG